MIISDRHSKASGGCTYSSAGKLENEQEMENHEYKEIRRLDGCRPELIETVIKRDGKLLKLEMRHTSLTDDMISGKAPWPALKADYFVVVASPLTLAPSRVEPHKQNMQTILATLQRKHANTPRMLISSTDDEYSSEKNQETREKMRDIKTGECNAWVKKYGAQEHRDIKTGNSWKYDDPTCQMRTFYYDIHRKAYESMELSASRTAVKEAPARAALGGAKENIRRQQAQSPSPRQHASSAKPVTPAHLVSRSSPVMQAAPSSSSASGRHSPPRRGASPPKKKKWYQIWKKSPPRMQKPAEQHDRARVVIVK